MGVQLRSLAATDLNLLVALQALLETGSVTTAAGRVGVTQPAMSRSLARLRQLFGDPLLVRSGRSMAPTPFARALAPELAETMGRLVALLEPGESFDPEAERTVRVAMVDYAGAVLLPSLVEHLAEVAPRLILEVLPLTDWRTSAADLATGRLDAAVGFGHDVADLLECETLVEDRFVCIVRRGHPRVRKRLSLRAFVDLPHVLVSTRGRVRGAVDVALAQRGLERSVAVTVPHFLVAPQVVRKGDCIATMAERIVALAPQGLRRLEPPLPISGFSVVLAWHPTQRESRVQVWLREQISEVAAQV